MKSFALVIVLMGLAAACVMVNAVDEDFDVVAEETRHGRPHRPAIGCPETQLDDFQCPACKVHLTAMLTTTYFNQLLHVYCSTVPRVPARSGRARARCFHLANSEEAPNMVTSDLVDTLCKNGNRCP